MAKKQRALNTHGCHVGWSERLTIGSGYIFEPLGGIEVRDRAGWEDDLGIAEGDRLFIYRMVAEPETEKDG